MSSNRHGISPLGIVALQVALGLTALASHGQTTTALATPRINSAVDTSQMVTLKGNTHPLAQPRFDRGLVPDATPTGRMMLVLKRSDEQQATLEHMLAAQQDSHSPSYHKWLTPETYGAQFGVSDADVQSVTSFLSSQGFAVSRVFSNKMAVEFSGTAGQIRSTFQTELHTYTAHGQTFHANASDPKIPVALAPVVSGIAAMNNYKALQRPVAQPLILNRGTGQVNPLYLDRNPNHGFNSFEAISPGDLAVIYDIPTASYTGQGVTVGIINDSNINLAIPANYRTTFSLPPATVPTAVIADGDDPGITADEALGYKVVELISAVAPAAGINYYVSATTDYASGLQFATFRAVQDNAVQVLVFPFESCERDLGAADNFIFTSLWQQAAAQGISVIVGTGTGGAEECDAVPSGNRKTAANQGLAVNGYASTAYNTAVGASDFYYPGGLILDFGLGGHFNFGTTYTDARGYIREKPDNSSNTSGNLASFGQVVEATGGGISTLGEITLSSPTGPGPFVQGPHPQPSYQTSVASGISATARVVPDVSMFGGTGDNFSSYILCIDPGDCVNGSPALLQFTPGGDSNASAAVFAGAVALLIQAKNGAPQGNLNPTLYATHARTPGAFHDITAGTNAVQCVGGSPNCVAGFSSGYQAGPGYDAASGLGSIDVAQLISAWQPPNALATVVLTLTQPGPNIPAPNPLRHGDPVQVNVRVTGSSGTPTGDVAITTSSPQVASQGVESLTLINGQAADGTVSYLPGGSYTLIARYAGDQTFGPAVISIPITVSQVASRIDVSSQNFTNGSAQAYGLPIQFTLTLANPANRNDVGTPSGSMTIRDNGADVAILPVSSLGSVTFQSSRTDPGAHSFTAVYTGDNSYASTTLSTPLTVTVGPAPTSTTLSGTAASLASNNGTVTFVATVTPTTASAAGPAPRGSVQFFLNGAPLGGAVRLSLGVNTGTDQSATAVIRPAANLFLLSNLLTASFIPDVPAGDYAASTSAPLNFNVGLTRGLVSTTTTLASAPLGIVNVANSGTLGFTATVTPSNATGSVTFFSNGTQIGQSNVSGGAATLNLSTANLITLPLGQSYIVAQYSGDANNATSSANPYTVNIYGHGSTPDFTMQSLQSYGVVSPTIPTATFRLQFGALNNFDRVRPSPLIALTFTTPPGLTCAANPASVTLSVPYTNDTVTCQAASGIVFAQLSPPNPRLLWMAEGGAALACVFLFGMPARRRSWQSMIGALALIVVAFGVTGCGVKFPDPSGASSSKNGQIVTGNSLLGNVLQKGTYKVIVTGTAAVLANGQPNTTVSVVHTLPLNIVVQ